MRNPDEARYPISTAAKVARMNLATARSWFQKRLIYSETDLRASAGIATLVSERTILTLAIAWDLADMGLHPTLACKAASGFTLELDMPMKSDMAALYVYPDGSFQHQVLEVDRKLAAARDAFFPAVAAQARYERVYTLLVNFIDKRVVTSLDEIERQGSHAQS